MLSLIICGWYGFHGSCLLRKRRLAGTELEDLLQHECDFLVLFGDGTVAMAVAYS